MEAGNSLEGHCSSQDGEDISFYQDDGCGDGKRWMDG